MFSSYWNNDGLSLQELILGETTLHLCLSLPEILSMGLFSSCLWIYYVSSTEIQHTYLAMNFLGHPHGHFPLKPTTTFTSPFGGGSRWPDRSRTRYNRKLFAEFVSQNTSGKLKSRITTRSCCLDILSSWTGHLVADPNHNNVSPSFLR